MEKELMGLDIYVSEVTDKETKEVFTVGCCFDVYELLSLFVTSKMFAGDITAEPTLDICVQLMLEQVQTEENSERLLNLFNDIKNEVFGSLYA